jgi:PAS domain S-box-containing protein
MRREELGENTEKSNNDSNLIKKELLEQEKVKIASVLDSIPGVIYIADPKTYELLMVNSNFTKYWGSGVIGKKCYKVLQDLDAPCEFCTNETIFNNNNEFLIWEFQNMTTQKWFRCYDRAIEWGKDRFVRFELALEISEEKDIRDKLDKAMEDLKELNKSLEKRVEEQTHHLNDANEKLRLSKQQLESIFSNMKDSIFVVSNDKEIIFSNDNTRDYFGENLIGKKCYDILEENNSDCSKDCPFERLKTNELCQYRYEINFYKKNMDDSKKRKKIIFDTVSTKIDNYNGQSAILLILRDITHSRKLMEKSEREKSVQLAIGDIYKNAIKLTKKEELAQFSLKIAEKVSGAKFGFIGSVNEQGKFDTFAMSDPGWDICKYPDSQAAKLIQDMEIRGLWSIPLRENKEFVDNNPLAYPESNFITDEHPELTSFMAIPFTLVNGQKSLIALGNKEGGFTESDVEDVKKLLGAIRESLIKAEIEEMRDKLNRKNKLEIVGKLAGSVSHELRNPLGVINNSSYYLKMKLKDADDKVKKHLNILEKEVNRANNIISDLLDFSRAKPPNMSVVDIHSILKASIHNVKKPDKIEIKKDLDSTLPNLMLDPFQMEQVFINLITNGIQAMPEGGTLHLVTEKDNDELVIKISDTGVGIPPENFKKLYEPLFSTKVKGVGLGLSIVKEIVERHNGTITFESEMNKGTTFIIKFPIMEIDD